MSLFEKQNYDLILLQECESIELSYFKNAEFIRKNYFIISVDKTSGADTSCVILSKSKPKSANVLRLCENSSKAGLIASFEMRTSSLRRVEKFLVVNIHLTSGKANNFFEKRKSQLETLKRNLIDTNSFESDYTLIGGDFNFGDDEENLIENHLIRDLFLKNDFNDLASNLFSFNPLTNFSASITASKLYPRRLDRVLFKNKRINTVVDGVKLANTAPFKIELKNHAKISIESYLNITSYTTENLINENKDVNDLKPVPTGIAFLHPSDHYGIEFRLKFKDSLHETNLVHKSTLAIVAPKFATEMIQKIRSSYDPQVVRWPPHINLLYPFYMNINSGLEFDDDGTVLSDLFECLSHFEPFECELNQMQTFGKNNVIYIEPKKESKLKMTCIYDALAKLFGKDKWRSELTPHMTIAQPVDKRTASKTWSRDILNKIKSDFGEIGLKFQVDAIFWMTRSETSPFEIKCSIPLGKRYPSILNGLNSIDLTANNLFKFLLKNKIVLNNEMENEFSLSYRNVVSSIKKGIIGDCMENKKTNNQIEFESSLDYNALILQGSYVHGIKCNDLDLGLVRYSSSSNSIDDIVYNLAQDNNLFHIVRNVSEANVPIIELNLKKNSFSGADMQIHEIPDERFKLNSNLFYNNFNYMKNLKTEFNDWMKLASISGLFENQNLKKFIQNFKDFQILISFVKHWAKQRNIYGQAFGYLGGISWSIMVVFYLLKNPNPHLLELNNCAQRFEKLIKDFFKFYSSLKNSTVISLIDLDHVNKNSEVLVNKSMINVLRTVYPYFITSRNITEQVRDLIWNEFSRAAKVLESDFESEMIYEEVCKKVDINETHVKRIEFTIKYETEEDLNHILTLVKAKILGLVTSLQRLNHNGEVRAFTEITKFENKKLAKFYIGFDDNIEANNSQKQIVIDHCNSFIRSVKSLAHTSLFDLQHEILF